MTETHFTVTIVRSDGKPGPGAVKVLRKTPVTAFKNMVSKKLAIALEAFSVECGGETMKDGKTLEDYSKSRRI